MSKNIVPGDIVTCKYPVDAYYSNYGQNPKMTFKPSMIGKVAAITPKVTILKEHNNPQYDQCPDMIVIDFFCPSTQDIERASLNFCNAKKSKGTITTPNKLTYKNIARNCYIGKYNTTENFTQDVLQVYGEKHKQLLINLIQEYSTPEKRNLKIVLKEFASLMDDLDTPE